MKSFIFLLALWASQLQASEVYAEVFHKNYGKSFDRPSQNSIRLGAAHSFGEIGVWGFAENYLPKDHQQGHYVELSGVFPLWKILVFPTLGFSDDGQLKANQLYQIHLGTSLNQGNTIPFLGITRENYLDGTSNHYDYLKIGLLQRVSNLAFETWLKYLSNDNEDLKKGYNKHGYAWSANLTHYDHKIETTLGIQSSCVAQKLPCTSETRDNYYEYSLTSRIILNKEFSIKPGITHIVQKSAYHPSDPIAKKYSYDITKKSWEFRLGYFFNF